MTTSAAGQDLQVFTICKQKLRGGRASWQGYELDKDADGLWLFTPAGSTFRSSDGRQDGQCEVEGGNGPGLDSLILVPDASKNWLATWYLPQRTLRISIEICAWVRRDADVVSFMDWELDPFRQWSGLVAVEDVDDFADARAAGLLTDADAELAIAATAWAERALKHQTDPFDARGDHKLVKAGQIGLPALLDVPHPFDL